MVDTGDQGARPFRNSLTGELESLSFMVRPDWSQAVLTGNPARDFGARLTIKFHTASSCSVGSEWPKILSNAASPRYLQPMWSVTAASWARTKAVRSLLSRPGAKTYWSQWSLVIGGASSK